MMLYIWFLNAYPCFDRDTGRILVIDNKRQDTRTLMTLKFQFSEQKESGGSEGEDPTPDFTNEIL